MKTKRYSKIIPLAIVLTIALVLATFGYSFSKASTELSPTEIINLTNIKRAESGLEALDSNQVLNNAALSKAMHMNENDYFSHTSPDGKNYTDFMTEEGYQYLYYGENLAFGYNTASDVINAWMSSSGHRQNILNDKYKDIGIAVLKGSLSGNSGNIIVAMYGSQKDGVTIEEPEPVDSYQQKSDINSDGVVDIKDLSTLLGEWSTSAQRSDINGDGDVDIADISILLSYWSA